MDLSSITLNYKKITLHISWLQNFCLKEQPLFQSIQLNYCNIFEKIFNSSDLIFYQYFYKERMPDFYNFNKIIMTPDALYYDVTNYINEFLSIYHVNLSQKDIDLKLKNIIFNLQQMKNLSELRKNFPLLYRKYLEVERLYLQIHGSLDPDTRKKIFQSCFKQELLILKYIYQNRDNNFKEISNCNTILDMLDINKFSLIVASKIMEISKKTKASHTIEYLKKYLKNNQDLLERNYEIKKYISNEYGLGITEKFSVQDIYDYVYPNSTKQTTQKIVFPTYEQYHYNFLEASHTDPKEMLSKYYQLGIKSDNPEELKQLLERKIIFYQKLNINSIKIGLNSFDGYLGLCLEDSTVILDKFFDDLEKRKIAKDEAIYITDEENFEQVTKLSKQECMSEIKKGKIKARRVYHTHHWEDRIM